MKHTDAPVASPERRYVANGTRIRKARRRIGQSQETFAGTVGTTRRHMIRLENGQQRPGARLRDRICEAAGIDRSQVESSDDDQEADLPLSRDDQQLLIDLLGRLASVSASARRCDCEVVAP